jgi:phytoene synthase
VRRHDRDRYQTALFAPAERRGALLALYAFNYESPRARDVASRCWGQIRLQWWREVLDSGLLPGRAALASGCRAR